LALLLGWVVPRRFSDDLAQSSTPPALRRFLLVLLRWVSPPIVATGLVISVIDLVQG
jgi:NSS family neurotransmitter:Na+ symporter